MDFFISAPPDYAYNIADTVDIQIIQTISAVQQKVPTHIFVC